MVFLQRSIDIRCCDFPEGTSRATLVGYIDDYFKVESQSSVVAIQECLGGVARVTFAVGGNAAKAFFEEQGSVVLGGVECEIVQPPPPPPMVSTVVVSWFPFEGSNAAVTNALSGYGEVKDVRLQVWPGRPSLSTGSRLVRMVISKEIPRFISVAGIKCKIWFRGQPLRCDLCHKISHKALSCPLKGKSALRSAGTSCSQVCEPWGPQVSVASNEAVPSDAAADDASGSAGSADTVLAFGATSTHVNIELAKENNVLGKDNNELVKESNGLVNDNNWAEIVESQMPDSNSNPVIEEVVEEVVAEGSSSVPASDDIQWTTVTRKRPDSHVQSSLLGNLSSFLPQDQSNSCEGLFTPSEVFDALKGMARNKTPCLDGLPMEFYLRFWDGVGADLVAVLNECFSSGSLSLSQRRGVITLSFKKGDRLDPKNWRPISLLNMDYKLASRFMAGRLLRVIHLVVNHDQTCGVPGRFIGENVALLRDVVSYAESSGTPVAILSLDQEKAFDRVDWGFMRSTLVAIGFGPSFVAWIDLFYTRVQSAVSVNGYLTPFFGLSRDVRQGCPLSPLLYVLVSEVLDCSIRADPRIKGLFLPGCPPLSPISKYADDTSLILTSDEGISAALDIYRCYELASGSRINLS
ncbi:Transposon TX1 uncharacterized 149 kDa protein [Stylophora pistillata]|uniref:Transposon TX1 uncharacterized 149 kDa protein n=1 Tax=Stylophora pistillata TaxID=50429 RepID=A0A2B4R6Y0_STYPI|nr:Transposon TX1 uncharacterized 149 kDa protein [Stylophora pistillata]